MLFKLFKVPYKYKDKKGIERTNYNYYLVSENNVLIKILPNSYQDDKGNYVSNKKDLTLLSSFADEKGVIQF